MGSYHWWMDYQRMKEGLRFATMVNGEQSVMMNGLRVQQTLHADRWEFMTQHMVLCAYFSYHLSFIGIGMICCMGGLIAQFLSIHKRFVHEHLTKIWRGHGSPLAHYS